MILFIFQVLAFFSARLEQHPDQTLSVGVVLDVIKQGALQWPRDRLKVTCLSSVKTKHFKVFQTVHSLLSVTSHVSTSGNPEKEIRV